MTDAIPLPGADPSLRAVLDALAFTVAAASGDAPTATAIANESLDDPAQRPWFLDALVSTIQLIVDTADDVGVDATAALRDVALGVQMAHLAEIDRDRRRHDP